LEVFDRSELSQQRQELECLRDDLPPCAKNTRRALLRQIEKVENRIKELDSMQADVEADAPRRCRSCLEPYPDCDGRCWGFWKDTSGCESTASLKKGRRGKQTSSIVMSMIAIFLFTMTLVPSGAAAHAFSLQPIFSPNRRRYRGRQHQRRSTPRRPMTYEEYQSHFLDDENWMTDKKTRLWNGNRSNRKPNQYSWTSKLVISNVVSYIMQVINPRVTSMGIKLSERIMQGQELYRLVTPAFLHGSPIHLFTNMYSLNNIGPMVEQCFGSGRFLALYLISGAAGNLLSAMNSPNPALGASGAVFGVMGAMYVFLNRNDWLLGEQGEAFSSAITQTLLINLVIGYVNPMVDNWGHLGGAIGGAAMAYYFGPRLFLAKLPDEGGQVIVDKPILRLPPAIEHIPKNIDNGISRMVRRMQIWRFKDDLRGKPWQPKEVRRSDYQRRKYMPNKSIKPKLDD
jgi:uridine nucleosidase